MIVVGESILNIASEYLWGLLAVVLIVFGIASFVLNFHWKRYGLNRKSVLSAKTLFWGVSIGLIILAFILLIIIEIAL